MPFAMPSVLALSTILPIMVIPTQADPNDWVNVNYVLQQGKSDSPSLTSDAQNNIAFGAVSSARRGPWSVTNSHGNVAPSGDPHDYLSWAPYHWPNCNWCNRGGTVHLVHSPNATDNMGDSDPPSSGDPDNTDPYPGGPDENEAESQAVLDTVTPSAAVQPVANRRNTPRRTSQLRHASFRILDRDDVPSPENDSESEFVSVDVAPSPDVPIGGPPPLPTLPPIGLSPDDSATQTSERMVNGTPAPAQAPAKTQKGGRSSCTPSPTASIAPSSTWTTCPYVVRDGQVNPDVRTLNGPSAINSVSQSILYNAIAYAFKPSTAYSQNVASFIDIFFLNPSTKMSPNMNYGQMVRGPGKAGQTGTFTGILDLRGIVKIVNAILVLKGTRSPEWTSARERGIKEWMVQYSEWLEDSSLGKSTASRANNHNTFYVSQLAAAKMLVDDNAGAAAVLQNYFTHQFLDQVAASGEQPFEAVRTRPFHYRCFNLEAMIVNAKLGDQLGLNFWSAKSKYGATIQTTLDYTMALSPKGEDVTEIVPHVASVAAAYGDPKGKYAAFMRKTMVNYQSKPFWFYDQTLALPSSPAAGGKRSAGSMGWAREDSAPGVSTTELPFAAQEGRIAFECPAVFASVLEVEVDNGVFVNCSQLKPYYESLFPL